MWLGLASAAPCKMRWLVAGAFCVALLTVRNVRTTSCKEGGGNNLHSTSKHAFIDDWQKCYNDVKVALAANASDASKSAFCRNPCVQSLHVQLKGSRLLDDPLFFRGARRGKILINSPGGVGSSYFVGRVQKHNLTTNDYDNRDKLKHITVERMLVTRSATANLKMQQQLRLRTEAKRAEKRSTTTRTTPAVPRNTAVSSRLDWQKARTASALANRCGAQSPQPTRTGSSRGLAETGPGHPEKEMFPPPPGARTRPMGGAGTMYEEHILKREYNRILYITGDPIHSLFSHYRHKWESAHYRSLCGQHCHFPKAWARNITAVFATSAQLGYDAWSLHKQARQWIQLQETLHFSNSYRQTAGTKKDDLGNQPVNFAMLDFPPILITDIRTALEAPTVLAHLLGVNQVHLQEKFGKNATTAAERAQVRRSERDFVQRIGALDIYLAVEAELQQAVAKNYLAYGIQMLC